MKRIFSLALAVLVVLGLCACSRSAAATWQEQYDLGVRYLSEGNYREAVIAFNAAIEIDPKRAEAYIGLADAYEAQGDLEQARQVLADALAVVSDQSAIQSRLDSLGEGVAPGTTPGPAAGQTQGPALGTTEGPTSTSVLPAAVIASGDCGENMTWTLDSNGLLTISGTGPMEDYGWGAAPWNENRDSIITVVIENGVTSIGRDAFGNYSSLISVTIPNSVTTIENFAIYNCFSLTSVTIPDSVTSIGNLAFCNSDGLTSMDIPNSVTSIGEGAFAQCYSLTGINVASENPSYISVDGVLFNTDQTLLLAYPAGKSGSSYSIPASVTRIGHSAFGHCHDLTSVTIPDSVTSIGNSAFYSSNLTGVTIPNSVTAIDDYVFLGCESLTSVTIPDSVTNIGIEAFCDCDSLTDVYYSGSEAQWNQIKVGDSNAPLLTAAIHYNS